MCIGKIRLEVECDAIRRLRFFRAPERAQGVTESVMGFCKIRPNVDGRS
jgi:hypothetical protein